MGNNILDLPNDIFWCYERGILCHGGKNANSAAAPPALRQTQIVGTFFQAAPRANWHFK